VDMGAAGATQAQAGDQALKNAEESLRSYGINPSDGRYAALDKAAAVQNAANVAGAQNMQRERTAEVGRGLRREAVQVGAMLPAAIANVNNTAIQANTGASNASLANANTGANLQRLPNEFLKTAMDIKLPPTGQNSQSTGSSRGSGSSSSPDGDRGSQQRQQQPGGGQGGGGGERGGGPAWMPSHGDAQARGGGGGRGGMYGQPGSGIISNVDKKTSWPEGPNAWSQQNWDDPLQGVNASDFQYGYNPQEGYSASIGGQGYSDDPVPYRNNPFNDTNDYGQNDTYGGGGDYDQFGGGNGYNTYSDSAGYGNSYDAENSNYGNLAYDPGANSVDPGWGQTDVQVAPTEWGSGADAYSNTANTLDSGSFYYQGDNSSDYNATGGVYAEGGPVPPRMSPSGGQRVDDVPAMSPQGPAQLNANEFVIPQDVAMWKGQEFFQKLIEQSRARRVTAPAQGGPQ